MLQNRRRSVSMGTISHLKVIGGRRLLAGTSGYLILLDDYARLQVSVVAFSLHPPSTRATESLDQLQ